jgi:hypothetical protein
MTVGVGLFFVGVLGVMALLFASGAAQKSRQFEVLGQLWSGKLGVGRRRLVRTAFLLAGSGAVLCFAGVAGMDAERAARCHDHCIASGYHEGKIGPSQERSKSGRFVACVCQSPDRPPLELRADAVGK